MKTHAARTRRPRRPGVGFLLPALVAATLPWLMGGCETTRTQSQPTGPATVAMPEPTNQAEASFIGDIGSALRSRGWDPQPAAKVPTAGHRIQFAIRSSGEGFGSLIELRTAEGRMVANGAADSDRMPEGMGALALVFDDSLAAFQRSLARVPTPAAP